MLYGAMRHHPNYRNQDYGWFSDLCGGLPEDDTVARAARKAKKKVAYDVLLTVPQLIRGSRVKRCSDPKQAAWVAHDELLMAWITTLPWRQRNIRECRIGDPGRSNIFFAALSGPGSVHIARPEWVQKALTTTPHQGFWQFYFLPEETKTAHEVRGILPRRLIPLLEQYIAQHRPLLVVPGRDPATLFLNRDGGALDQPRMTDLVAELTLRHTGVRVTPHIIRDIFAFAWLEAHPEDFLTLSKILWHQDVKYTLRVYGSDYDESNGARSIDQWLGD